MTQSLDLLWQELELKGSRPAFRRVDENHPLDLYVGIDADGTRALLLLSDQEPPGQLTQTKGFEIERGRRADGRWALTVRLRASELSKFFAHLCTDLVDASRSGIRARSASQFVLDRIARWERLLARSRGKGLDERSFRGLVAELAVLNRIVIPALGATAAIEAWLGPLDADQDFRTHERLLEVKSTVPGSLTVTISSAEQLDVHDFPLVLVAVPVETSAAIGPMGETLEGMLVEIREHLIEDAAVLELFDDRLSMTGYDAKSEFVMRRIGVGPMSFFRVRDKFPLIARSSLSPAIRSVRYQLDLGLCRNFEITNAFA